jgi:hypothetical protein
MFLLQLKRRLEEIDMQPRRRKQSSQ